MSADLITRNTVRTLVTEFQRAELAVREHFAGLHAAMDRVNGAFGIGGEHRVGGLSIYPSRGSHHYASFDADDVEHALMMLRRQAWDVLAARLEIRKAMSSAALAEFERQIQSEDPPPITEETTVAWMLHMVSTQGERFQAKCVEVFDAMRPRSDDRKYKTNKPYEIGERVVLTWMVEPNWIGGWRVRYDHKQRFTTALESVFRGLDGKGYASSTSQHGSELEDAICSSATGRGETEYFEFKCFKNGNLHLRFKRPDLVARLNQVAGGMRLRGEAA